MASTNDLKNGMVLKLEGGQLWSVVEFQHVKPGKGPAFVRTKLKNVLSGKVVDKTFNAGVKVDTATIDSNPCPDPVSGDGAQFCTIDDVVVIWDGDQAALFEFGDTGIAWAAVGVYIVLVFWVLEGTTGGTPGKFLFGIRTVSQ